MYYGETVDTPKDTEWPLCPWDRCPLSRHFALTSLFQDLQNLFWILFSTNNDMGCPILNTIAIAILQALYPLFKPHNNSVATIISVLLLLFLFYRWGHWDTERLDNLPKVIQVVVAELGFKHRSLAPKLLGCVAW